MVRHKTYVNTVTESIACSSVGSLQKRRSNEGDSSGSSDIETGEKVE